MAANQPTTDHAVIRQWAERHNAYPVEIRPRLHDGVPSIIQFCFRGSPLDYPEFRELAWDEFFARFDLMGLAFVHEPEGPSGGRDYQILQIESKSPYRFGGHPV